MKRVSISFFSLLLLFAVVMSGCASKSPDAASRARVIDEVAFATEKPAPAKASAENAGQAVPKANSRNQTQKAANIVADKEIVFTTFQTALSAMKSADWATAEKKLKQTIDIDSGYAAPYANLGIVYMKQEKYSLAEHALKDAISKNGRRADFYNLLGVALRQQGKFHDAEKAYKDALEEDNKYALAYLNLGVLYDLYLLDYENAKKAYRQYAQLGGADEKQVNAWLIDIQKRSQASN